MYKILHLLKIKFFLFLFVVPLLAQSEMVQGSADEDIVLTTKQIVIPNYPNIYNPSLIRYQDKYIFTFRYKPNSEFQNWISHVGIVILNDAFEPISTPQLLQTRIKGGQIDSQSEDARLFSFDNKLYIVYNDNTELVSLSHKDRRDMYIAEIVLNDGVFSIFSSTKLVYGAKYEQIMWQKNWSPFVYQNKLHFIYSVHPHEIINVNLNSGFCNLLYETSAEKSNHWLLGQMRGGTPAHLVEDEYLTFFHSGIVHSSAASNYQNIWHYYMGAYTFSKEPPFYITSVSRKPIDHPSFYTCSDREKRVIYPCGCVLDGSLAYVSYGKDDYEAWIATIDIKKLKDSMIKVNDSK